MAKEQKASNIIGWLNYFTVPLLVIVYIYVYEIMLTVFVADVQVINTSICQMVTFNTHHSSSSINHTDIVLYGIVDDADLPMK